MTNPLFPIVKPVRFQDVRPEHVRPAVDAAIAASRERVRKIVAGEYEDFLGEMDDATLELDSVIGVVSHLEGAVTTDELREAYAEIQEDVSNYYTSVGLSSELWTKVKGYAATDEAKSLTGPRARALKQTVDGFRDGGADLPGDKKARLSEINAFLAEACLKFSQNSLDSSNAWETYVDLHRLKGIPDAAVSDMRAEAVDAGKDGYRVSLKAPCYSAVIQHAEDRELRREVFQAQQAKGTLEPWNNRPLIREILRLRKELALLLGYKDFADMVLSDRMAKSGAGAWKLLNELRDAALPAFRKEAEELQSYRDSKEGVHVKLELWDGAFWAERLRKETFAFDEEELRDYLPYEACLTGVFELSKSLYGVSISPWTDTQVWDDSVRAFRILDFDGKDLGGFYVDPFVRANKSEGAWMNGLFDGIDEPAIGLICMNFTMPTADRPCLLRHYELETLFHEFGHLLHHMLSRAKMRGHFGTSVAWDFVELPSQVMEHWTWDRECLGTFARHWQSGDPLPDDLFAKLLSTRKFRGGTGLMRFTGYSMVDLALHIIYDLESDGDPLEFARGFQQPFYVSTLPETGDRIASFTHVFGDPTGYAAGYYSYQWAEVLDADAYSKFEELGHMSRAAGEWFRVSLLERGDEEDPAVLFRNFMGRDPDVKAVLRKYGLE